MANTTISIVRTKNLFAGAQTGTVKLYYSLPTVLLIPSVWINNAIPNGNDTNEANVSAAATNDISVGVGPFYWSPAPLPTTDNHYCLIAQVITTQDPNPIPADDDLGAFAQWVRNHPGIAWRNVSLVSISGGPNFQNFVGLENPEADPRLVTLTITCKNIPDGTTIKALDTTTGPNPPININGTVGPDNQTAPPPNKENLFSTVTTLPANFKEKIDVRATCPVGVEPPPGAEITMTYYVNVANDDPNANIGFEPEEFNLTHEDIGFSGGGKMLLLGDYTFEFTK